MKLTLLTLIIFYILIGLFLYIKQDNFLFFPMKYSLHEGKDIFLKNKNEVIHIIVLNENKSKALIYFGGNAENLSLSSSYIKNQFPEYKIFLMNYPNYGLSEGILSEKSIFSNAIYTYDYIKKDYNNIVIGGRSLGSSVAAYVASKRNIRKLALITPYNSIENIAQDRFLIYPISILLKNKFITESFIDEINTETLIIVAENDNLVKKKYSDKLINKFKKLHKNYSLIIIKERNHIDISSDPIYYKSMQNFIK